MTAVMPRHAPSIIPPRRQRDAESAAWWACTAWRQALVDLMRTYLRKRNEMATERVAELHRLENEYASVQRLYGQRRMRLQMEAAVQSAASRSAVERDVLAEMRDELASVERRRDALVDDYEEKTGFLEEWTLRRIDAFVSQTPALEQAAVNTGLLAEQAFVRIAAQCVDPDDKSIAARFDEFFAAARGEQLSDDDDDGDAENMEEHDPPDGIAYTDIRSAPPDRLLLGRRFALPVPRQGDVENGATACTMIAAVAAITVCYEAATAPSDAPWQRQVAWREVLDDGVELWVRWFKETRRRERFAQMFDLLDMEAFKRVLGSSIDTVEYGGRLRGAENAVVNGDGDTVAFSVAEMLEAVQGDDAERATPSAVVFSARARTVCLFHPEHRCADWWLFDSHGEAGTGGGSLLYWFRDSAVLARFVSMLFNADTAPTLASAAANQAHDVMHLSNASTYSAWALRKVAPALA